MKSNKHIHPSSITTVGSARIKRAISRLGVTVAGVLLSAHGVRADNPAQSTDVGNIFVIALENHNLTQPNPASSPQQILGNPAAPYINSLMTPGNSNAVSVSYAVDYHNAGKGVHPSEPNYVWAEAGTDFGFHSDADPSAANGNTFYDDSFHLVSGLTANGSTLSFWHRNLTPHLTGQLNDAGISWKNYQEDVQLSSSPTVSASGTNGPVNPFNGTTQYNYAVKHNPMAFFSDTSFANVFPLAQFFTDLANNSVSPYNWITPDQYNDAHSALTGGFTYQGVHYTGDQSAIAAADNFLSQVVPEIMASKAYQNNGVIILWWDETENGDTSGQTIPEIIISPLAKGNAYASSVELNHSSDLKTMEQIFHLPFINNPIPASETNLVGDYNNVATANDLSDLFKPGVIPAAPSLSLTYGGFEPNPQTQGVSQKVQITNDGDTPVPTTLSLVLDNLSANATLLNADGTTAVLAPLGSPFVNVRASGNEYLPPHASVNVTLEFSNSTGAAITYTGRVLDVVPAP
jgi:hypothetical protein